MPCNHAQGDAIYILKAQEFRVHDSVIRRLNPTRSLSPHTVHVGGAPVHGCASRKQNQTAPACELGERCTFASYSLSCTKCEKGRYSDDGVACYKCPPGEFSNASGAPRCANCTGHKIPTRGNDNCTECRSPAYFNASQRACDECKAGQQRNASSATTPCGTCAPGKAGVGGQCSSCSVGQAPNKANTSW